MEDYLLRDINRRLASRMRLGLSCGGSVEALANEANLRHNLDIQQQYSIAFARDDGALRYDSLLFTLFETRKQSIVSPKARAR